MRPTFKGQPKYAPDSRPKLCECEKPWDGGEGYCMRCGKTLASDLLMAEWRR